MDKADDDLRKLTVISWAAIAALAVLLAVVAWLSWPGPEPGPAPRAREYRDYDLCLLTDQGGIQGDPAAKVWQGLQKVSLETRSRVSFLPVTGEQTEAVATQFVATQVQQSCDIIVAVGGPQVNAVGHNAGRYPAVRFVVVDAPPVFGGANLTNADAGSVADQVRPLVAK
jgi:basic membrane lipoprotein Med (substrate-binding protein (PBP1-ABC) superfamily)